VLDLRGGGLYQICEGSEACTERFKVLLVTVHEIGTDWFEGRGAVYSKWRFVCGAVTTGCAGWGWVHMHIGSGGLCTEQAGQLPVHAALEF
jgi:hypothetical protein